MDELSTIQQLLAEPPPGPDVVEAARLRLERATLGGTPLRTGAPGRGRRAPGLVRRGAAPRRWPGWLAPVAAATAVVAVVLGSLGISGVIRPRPAGTGATNVTGVFAKVPRFFVANGQERAVVGATATGAVLGTVAPPAPDKMFSWVAAAGDGRTFVFGATPGVDHPVRFYRLVLSRSGHPGRLTPLPIPQETATVTGLTLSPDGSKLAVSLAGTARTRPTIQVFSLATGTRQEWAWPGQGRTNQVSVGGSNSWETGNQTLLFEETARSAEGWPGQLRLLDTAAPGGSLLAASTRIPVPAKDVGWQHNNATHRIIGIPLITGDGTKLIAPFFHLKAKPKMFGFTITEFSVRTGKPVRVIYQKRTGSEAGSTAVMWVNTSGSAIIVGRGSEYGVQTPTTFTPFPLKTQRLFFRDGTFFRLPVW